ncbi:MAG: hypothetical protein ACNA8L_02000 [Luteolibacter sp.]
MLPSVSMLHATPERVVNIDERLIGTSDGSHAILRTERDNLGSHYSDRENIWLDEYVSGEAGRQLVKSTHLLDVSYIIDANHTDPNTPPAVERRVAHEDDTLALASVLSRYPLREPLMWPESRMEMIVSTLENGIRFKNKVMLLNAKTIRETFGKAYAEHPWTLKSIMESGGMLFLTIGKSRPDETREIRIFHVSPEASQTVRDQLELQPIYLVAGSFESIDEAITAARTFKARARENKTYGFHPEIWEERHPSPRVRYHIALPNTMHLIESGRLVKTQEALGLHLVPTSSKHFWRRTHVE